MNYWAGIRTCPYVALLSPVSDRVAFFKFCRGGSFGTALECSAP